MRRALQPCAAAAAIVSAAAASAGASGTRPTLHSDRSLIQYGERVTLAGHAAAGARVTLQADPFPFRGEFRAISSARAGADGDYSLTARPSHATRYRVLGARGGRSAPVSVYVDDRVERLSCNLCAGANSPGLHTLSLSYTAEAPPGRVAVRGPVYFYFGLVSGAAPPAKISLLKRVALHRSGHTLRYSIAYAVDFPATAFQFRVAACFKAAEARDGVGLPGHHHCGARTLSRKQYLNYLG
jgi:hypothetical protein